MSDPRLYLADQLAHTLARHPSTVFGSTVTVRDRATGEVLTTAIAPLEETLDGVLTSLEALGLPLDKSVHDIAAFTAMRIDETYRMAENVFDLVEAHGSFDDEALS